MTIEQLVVTDPAATIFDLGDSPVLSEGRLDIPIGRSDGFGARVKLYSEGGENATHTHLNEDHVFLVVGGEATFYLGRNEDETVIVGKYQGVFLPKGAYYRFLSSGNENLVMLRVGHQTQAGDGRVDANGEPLSGLSAANNHVDGVPVPGQTFGQSR
jgi:mannose-6-phosphate isomerase-like protein (cupin superfamily)